MESKAYRKVDPPGAFQRTAPGRYPVSPKEPGSQPSLFPDFFTASAALYCASEAQIPKESYPMSTPALVEAEITIAADDFSALEQRVVRAVELVRSERAARTQAEENAIALELRLEEQSATLAQTQEQLASLEREREQVRHRVERLLKQLDEITS